jgi:23S rRNA pseudouridine1911/1915/1917 synthase
MAVKVFRSMGIAPLECRAERVLASTDASGKWRSVFHAIRVRLQPWPGQLQVHCVVEKTFARSLRRGVVAQPSGSWLLFVYECGPRATCHEGGDAQMPSMDGDPANVISGVTGPQPARLDKALADLSGLSRERVKALLLEGHITIAGAKATQPSAKIPPGTAFTIDVPQAVSATAQAQDIPLVVVFEDEHLIVVDKPAGLVVHPAAGNLDGTLVNALLHHCRGQLSGIGGVARPGIVHRIDKDTSGLLVVAKTDVAHEGMARQFADHSILRSYRAVVSGTPKKSAGRIDGAIGRSSANRKKMALVEDGRGKHAITHYKVLEPLKSATLIECRLETGRTHQVRVHMSSIGHPLVGDPVYGHASAPLRPILADLEFRRQALHAAELGFVHPVYQETMQFLSAIPADMAVLIERLRH